MADEIYNAFVDAGLVKEANMLSEKKTDDLNVSVAIGQYIALADRLLFFPNDERLMESLVNSNASSESWQDYNGSLTKPALKCEALCKIRDYVFDLLKNTTIPKKLEKIRGLAAKLGIKPQQIPIVEIK